jgi:UPF0755 protein
MLVQRNRSVVLLLTIAFLFAQTAIFASIPGPGNSQAVRIVVKSGTGLFSIANKLKDDGLIPSSSFFVALSLLYRGQLIAGEYELRKDMSTMEIVRKLGRGERVTYTLKILEGHNIYNIAESIDKAGIMKKDEFLALSRDRSFLSRLGIKGDSLEGYLPPETYFFSRETDSDKFIERIARRTFKIFSQEDVVKRMGEIHFDISETLTLASMIEREAKAKEEKPRISAVFHNRLKKGMSLDCDPTVLYGTGAFDAPIRKSDLSTYTPYNTYVLRGLPKGPICNPDRDSIMAALYPASVDYLYFVSKNDGTHVFSRDIRDHNRFVALYQRSKNNKNHE